jgi:rhodanese-related sulfurtransferase
MSRATPEITTDDLAALLPQGAVVIDVRETREYVDGHLPGAVHMPMWQVPARVTELDPKAPVYVVCATGNRSAAMTDFLAHHGFTAYSVAGGTASWARSGRAVVAGSTPDRMAPAAGAITVVPIETPTLGDRSYLVHDGEVAFVVDPQRDIDRVTDLLARHDVRLSHVFETHLHNDYVTGGHALAEKTGAAYLVNAADEVGFARTPVRDNETFDIGDRMRVTALATPGHTFTHLSYVLEDSLSGERVAVFSGGSLLYGATGRPDLLGAAHTHELVRAQHASAHRIADALPDTAELYPTHGFGSFCSASQSEATASTIGDERRTNPALTQGEEDYVRDLLAGLGAYPAYYARMAPANAAGPSEPDLSAPAHADPVELRRRIEAGEWIVDLRNRTVFAAGHLPGSLNFGLDDSFATYLGWLIEWGTPLTLLGETPAMVAEAQRELVRIGIDRPAAAATGTPADWVAGTGHEVASFPTATFADLAHVQRHREVAVLDVRRSEEHAAGRIEGSLNIPLHELPRRLGDVPAGEVWVHCAAGYRASVAASLLDAAGIPPVAIDDSFDEAAGAGLRLVGGVSG